MKRAALGVLAVALCACASVVFCAGSQIPSTAVEQRVIHLKADGTGDYPTLQDAITAAPEGTVIVLAAGTYLQTRPLVITKPLRLIGEGMDSTTIVSNAADCVMSVTTTGLFSMTGIAFQYQGEGPADVVVIEATSLEIVSCSFSGAVEAPPRRSWAGLRILGQTMGTVRGCIASGNTGEGITLEDQARVVLEGNRCVENAGCGIAFLGNASGRVSGNECASNGQAGIIVSESAAPILIENSCTKNAWAGILFIESASGLAQANECSQNGTHGIHVVQQAKPTLEANTCSTNKQVGIAYFGQSGGVARENLCQGNELFGIYVGEQAKPTLESNTCTANRNSGIAYFGNAAGTAKGNTCQGNEQHGIYVAEQANPLLEANTCSTNKQAGIAYFGQSGGVARQNLCQANGIGIYVGGKAQPTLEENTCSKNEGDGINVAEGAQPTIERNLCLDNKDKGIALEGVSGVSVSGNECSRNGWAGIFVYGGSQLTIEQNTCSEDGVAGIAFFEAAEGMASHNRCERNSIGILVGGSAKVALIGCQVSASGTDRAVCSSFPDEMLREVTWSELFLLVLLYGWPFEDISPGFGVYVYGTASVLMKDCEISGSIFSGVRLSGESSAKIENCRILNNAYGIEIMDAAKAHVGGTLSSGNRYTAVDVSGTAQATIEECHLRGNLVGIRAQDKARVGLRDTTVCDNVIGGLLVGSAHGEFTNTVVCDSKRGPMMLWDDAQVSITDCRFLSNAVDDVMVGAALYGLAAGEAVSAEIAADGAAVAFPEAPPEAVEFAVDAIVEVWPSGRDPVTGKYWEFAANGVILASGAIATVGHVFYGEVSSDPTVWLKLSSLEVVDADSQDIIYRMRDFRTGETPHGPHPAAISTSRDLAVLYPINPTVVGLPIAEVAAPYDIVWVVGYVGYLETGEIWRFIPGVISIPDRSTVKLWLLAWLASEKSDVLYSDVWITLPPGMGVVAGMSGSPVLDVDGRAIGIIMRRWPNTGLGAARLVDLPELKPLTNP